MCCLSGGRRWRRFWPASALYKGETGRNLRTERLFSTEPGQHNYSSVIIPYTCTAQGYAEYICDERGDSIWD